MALLNILSIDGGGTRGIIPATILDCIFQDTGKHPVDIFDLLAGTSTGGILCVGYGYGIDTASMVNLYLTQSKDIFYDSGWDDLRDGFGKNTGADYSNDRFKKILTGLFKNSTLATLHGKLPAEKGIMVCSFDLNPDDNGKPINFRPRVYHSDFFKDQDVKLVDLCLMTSAGPTYFPIYNNHVDGGVSLNNPSMAAVAYAINDSDEGGKEYRHPDGKRKGLGLSLKDVKVFSLGCGTSNKNYIAEEDIRKKDRGDWGNLQWVKYLPDMLTESNMQASDYYIRQLIPDKRLRRIQFEFDAKDSPEVLKNPKKVLGLDVKDPILLQALHDYAKSTYKKKKDDILKFLGL
jgi:uncharacterized protein